MKLVLLFGLLLSVALAQEDPICDGFSFQIQDDPAASQIIAEVREQFLPTRPHPFNRLDVSILLPSSSGWKRGSFQPFEIAYPARFCSTSITK